MSVQPGIPPAVPRVILIGGAPMSGKTSAARAVARLLDRVVVSTDDLGEAARALTSPETHRDLHAYAHPDMPRYYASFPPAALVDDARRAHRALWPAIEAVVRAHATWATPGVVEGWAILPELARQLPRESTACVWMGVAPAVLEARARDGSEFLSGGEHAERARAHFVARNVAFQRWVRERVAAAGLLWVEAGGDESAEAVARRCLESLGGQPCST
jgi:2-phosphoglycerate kinase